MRPVLAHLKNMSSVWQFRFCKNMELSTNKLLGTKPVIDVVKLKQPEWPLLKSIYSFRA